MSDPEIGPPAGESAAGGRASAGRGSRRRWRRPNTNGRAGKRSHRVEIKLTDAEYVKVKAAASVQRCSMPAVYTRAFATDGSMAALHYQFLRDDLSSARRLMVQVSNNLNQAVRLAHIHELEGTHSPHQFEDDLRAVASELAQVIGKVTRVVDSVDDIDGIDRDDLVEESIEEADEGTEA